VPWHPLFLSGTNLLTYFGRSIDHKLIISSTASKLQFLVKLEHSFGVDPMGPRLIGQELGSHPSRYKIE
jgi:hypothetical protein